MKSMRLVSLALLCACSAASASRRAATPHEGLWIGGIWGSRETLFVRVTLGGEGKTCRRADRLPGQERVEHPAPERHVGDDRVSRSTSRPSAPASVRRRRRRRPHHWHGAAGRGLGQLRVDARIDRRGAGVRADRRRLRVRAGRNRAASTAACRGRRTWTTAPGARACCSAWPTVGTWRALAARRLSRSRSRSRSSATRPAPAVALAWTASEGRNARSAASCTAPNPRGSPAGARRWPAPSCCRSVPAHTPPSS